VVIATAGDEGGEDPVVVREHDDLVPGVKVDVAQRAVHRAGCGTGPHGQAAYVVICR